MADREEGTMPEGMLERVANALSITCASKNFVDLSPYWQASYLDDARAAVGAMREPGTEVAQAGAEAISLEIMKARANYDGAQDCWQAMITAILEGK